jgi:hypothetical protein
MFCLFKVFGLADKVPAAQLELAVGIAATGLLAQVILRIDLWDIAAIRLPYRRLVCCVGAAGQ